MQANDLILHKARQGDAQAFTQLFEPMERMVYLTCLRLMGNEQDAQDCAQEAMLRAYRALHSYREDAKLTTWMYQIAYHTCIDAIRKRPRVFAQSLDEMAEEGAEVPARLLSPYAALEKRERMRLLEAAILELPQDLKDVLVVYHMQGLSYEEVAQVLGIKLGTVKSRLSRARDKIKINLLKDAELFPMLNVSLNEGGTANDM